MSNVYNNLDDTDGAGKSLQGIRSQIKIGFEFG